VRFLPIILPSRVYLTPPNAPPGPRFALGHSPGSLFYRRLLFCAVYPSPAHSASPLFFRWGLARHNFAAQKSNLFEYPPPPSFGTSGSSFENGTPPNNISRLPHLPKTLPPPDCGSLRRCPAGPFPPFSNRAWSSQKIFGSHSYSHHVSSPPLIAGCSRFFTPARRDPPHSTSSMICSVRSSALSGVSCPTSCCRLPQSESTALRSRSRRIPGFLNHAPSLSFVPFLSCRRNSQIRPWQDLRPERTRYEIFRCFFCQG